MNNTDDNELRAYTLMKKYQFDFSEKYRAEIKNLLEYEFAHYQMGSSEYLRFLCGYLYCIGNHDDISLIKKIKYNINMDVGVMVDGNWIDSMEEEGESADSKEERIELTQYFVRYYQSYFSDMP